MLQEMRKFNDNSSKLEAEQVVNKRVNSELCKRIVTGERQCWANARYSKRECLEVAGIPRQVDEKVLSSFRRLAAPVTSPILMTIIDSAKLIT